MKKYILFALVVVAMFFFCSTPMTMGKNYPAMYEEKTTTIPHAANQ